MKNVPQPLWQAIQKAASKYGVDPTILVGIWRIESASTFPNPAVNGKGYGGLFGTTLWNGSTQAQANLSASILANLIHTRGSLSAALLAYSGGGYSSVSAEGGPAKAGAPATIRQAHTEAPAPQKTPAAQQAPQAPQPVAQFDTTAQMPSAPPDVAYTHPLVNPPGAGPVYETGPSLWQQIIAQPGVSQDTLAYAQNASIAAGG